MGHRLEARAPLRTPSRPPLGPDLEALLHDLFAPILEDARGERRRRLERADTDLRRSLRASRDRDDAGPPAAALLLALPCFLESGPGEGRDDEDRRVRMRIVLELARQVRPLAAREGIDTSAASVRLDRAWRAALHRLRDDQAQRSALNAGSRS